MKKKLLLIILIMGIYNAYGQEPIQEAYVTRTFVNADGETWSEINFSAMVNVSSNRLGQLKISNAEFLTELSSGKAKMLDNSAYTTAEFTGQILTKTKTDKKGLVNTTFEGKLIFKTFEGSYSANAVITFIINQADVIGLKILNKENRKEMAVDLVLKD